MKISLILIFISFLLLVTSCREKTYEIKPYSETLSNSLQLRKGHYKKIIRGIETIFFYYRPYQKSAFPLVGDYRYIPASYIVTNKTEINEIINNLTGVHPEVPVKDKASGTLHIVVKFKGQPNKAAYFIVYCELLNIAPVFNYDSYGSECSSFIKWLKEQYPMIFVGLSGSE